MRAHGRERHEQQRRLADAGVAADQDEHAGTRPPPSTRSSSETPVEKRSASAASTSTRRRSGLAAPWPALGEIEAAARSSTSVLQPPHEGQRPSHLPVE